MKYSSAYQRGYRSAIIVVLGGKCKVCTLRDPRMLQIDHVSGGGNQHRAKHGGWSYLRSIAKALATKSGRKKFRLLCANHNALAAQSRYRKTRRRRK